MIDLILFIGNSIITTVLTIAALLIIFILFVYVISSIKLVMWSIRTKIFKNPFMWLNPLKLIKYSGCNTTFHTADGSYIIYYQSLIPKARFVSNDLS